jgi:hypothetical protein
MASLLLLLAATRATGVVFEDPLRFPGPSAVDGVVSDPQLAAAGLTAVIIWTESTTEVGAPSSVRFARSGDFGRTWSPGAALRLPEVLGRSPAVAGDGSGSWLAAWVDGTVRVSPSNDDGITWAEPLDTGLTASDVEVAAVTPGTWLLAAIRDVPNGAASDTLVVTSRSSDGGETWDDPVGLTRATNAATPRPSYHGPLAISLASRTGVAVLAWADVVMPGGVNPWEGSIVAFRSTDVGSSWVPLALPTIEGFAPTVAANDGGGWSIATKFGGVVPSTPPGGRTPQIQSAYSTDAGKTWQATSPVDDRVYYTPPPGPGISAAGADTWVAAWSTFTTEASGLAVAHRCNSGAAWSPVRRFPEPLVDVRVAGRDDEILVVGREAYPPEVIAIRGNTSAYCTGCDDGDPCTIDGGDLEIGCTHTSASMAPDAQDAVDGARVSCAGEDSLHRAIKRLRRVANALLHAEKRAKGSTRLVRRAQARTQRAARRVASVRERLSTECAVAVDSAVAACTLALDCAQR